MISIIIPTYNRAYLIERAVDSIINQTYANWELIIIDDGSTDNTAEVVNKYLKDERISYIKKQNTGGSDSRNVGVSLSKGEFITFLDSDDEALPDWLEAVSGHLKENVGILCVKSKCKFPDGTTYERRFDKINFYGRWIKVQFTSGSLFIRKSVFLGINGYDINIPTALHSELGYRLLNHLKGSDLEIKSIDKCLVVIYFHDGERQRKDWNKLNKDCIRFVEKFHDYFEKWDPQQLSNHYATIAYHFYMGQSKKQSIAYLTKAIRYNPINVRNYARMVKYALS